MIGLLLEARPCIPLIGSSKRAKKLRKQVDEFCGMNLPVLLSGDNGSMKTRVAQFIHEHGDDRDGSYIIFDPSHIPGFISEGLRGEKEAV